VCPVRNPIPRKKNLRGRRDCSQKQRQTEQDDCGSSSQLHGGADAKVKSGKWKVESK
jgi:hypothetical protein